MSTTDTHVKDCRHLIGGQWVDSAEGGTFDDLDPYTGDVVASVAAGGREDARRAIAAAHEAFAAWSQAGPGMRQAIFLKAADILESRRDEVVEWLAKETGCSFGFGMFQMGFVPGLFRQAAGAAYTPIGQVIPSDLPGAFAMGVRRPVGVVGAISPWNAALILSARAIASPLVFGNTVVLKPSEESPYVGGLLWGEIFAEAGLPDGVLNIVTHDRSGAQDIGDELVENPHVRRINFTGSTATGRKLAEAAGRNLKRIVLELGGQNPLIVLADADLEYAVNAAAFGAYLHQGQICMSARRIIVERPIADAFTSALAAKVAGFGVGDPREHTTIIGPLINPAGAPHHLMGVYQPHLVELAHAVRDGMIPYPGLPGPIICDFLSRKASRERYAPGTEFQIGRIELVSNTGTYVDTPFHRYADGDDLARQGFGEVAGAQLAQGPVGAGLDRVRPASDHLCHVLEGHVEVVVQDQEQPLPRRQAAQSATQVDPLGLQERAGV